MSTSIRLATLLSLAQRYVSFIIGLASAMVLARLLSPAETGVFSIAASLAAITGVVREFGISAYLIRAKTIERDTLRATFGWSLMVGMFLALVLVALAQPTARFYGQPALAVMLTIFAINLAILPIGTNAFALMNRELRFAPLFVINTATTVIGAVVAIGLAHAGCSFMSLAWATLATTVASVAMVAIHRPADTFIMPSLRQSRALLKFSGVVSGGTLIDQIARRSPDLIIGKALGFHEAGIFSKTTSIVDAFGEFFASAVNKVAFPALARRVAEGCADREDYLRIVRTMTVFPLAFYGFCALFAAPMVMCLFGPRWMEAVPLLRVGAIGGLLSAPYLCAWSALMANNQLADVLRIQVIGSIALVIGVAAGAMFGVMAIVVALLLTTCVKLALFQRGLGRGYQVSPGALLSSTGRSVACAVLGLIPASVALRLYETTQGSALLALACGAAVCAVALAGALYGLKHPITDELAKLRAERS